MKLYTFLVICMLLVVATVSADTLLTAPEQRPDIDRFRIVEFTALNDPDPDEKVVFFFNHLQKGRAMTTDYILRSELNGEFHLPPARLFGMYQPFIYTHSGSERLRVGRIQKSNKIL